MLLFFAHIPFVVNRAFSATPTVRLQQHRLFFTTNRSDRTFFSWRFHTVRPSHPGHSTILLRSERPNGMCAKLSTVAASNNRVHPTRSLYYCLFAPRIYGVVPRAHSVRGESRIQRNASGVVATVAYTSVTLKLQCTNWVPSQVFVSCYTAVVFTLTRSFGLHLDQKWKVFIFGNVAKRTLSLTV